MPFFGNDNILGTAVWALIFIVFMFFYPRLMVTQLLWKLNQSAEMLEGLTVRGKNIVLRKISKNPTREIKEAVRNFLEFFVIEPVNLDPFGIIKKLEHVVNLQEKRFKYFVGQIASKMDNEAQADLMMGLAGAVSLNQVAKIVRHFVELVRKTKNLQLAMILQMQLPLIERIAKALLKGTEALANGWPIGDAIGCLIAADMIGESKAENIEEDTVIASKKIKGKNVLVIKAKGPGGRLGKLGKAVEKVVRRNRIEKIITIDAAAKLEGEKTGSIAEGVGVAIGGIGVDRAYIENIAVNRDLPLDIFVIKMSQEEAIQPMAREILVSAEKVEKLVEENIAKSRERRILVVGVGNTAGVGNSKKDAVKAREQIQKVLKIVKARGEEEEKKGFWAKLTGQI